ncbi:Hypothetical predicted protein [Olea europaea subsp. europaea]|uniref:DRBM domain-containing protein n=1 Tax=Olea europaea subsp. europaea TaxID=158383 RepID=A0A8S0PCQ6_OLEEU|nr:Hypothetical predicted protein [Olea europaea subsp. europaea]
MYKCKLQELCQKRGWSLPEYTTARDGPDHMPRFKGVVNVNGQAFETPNQCKSSKEAQNLVARIACDHFIAQPSQSGQQQYLQPSSSSSAAHPCAGVQAVVPNPPWEKPSTAATVPVIVPSAALPVSEARPVAVAPFLHISVPELPPDFVIPPPPMPPARFLTAKTKLDVQPANKEIMQSNYEDNAQISTTNLDIQPANKEIMQMNSQDNAQISMVNSNTSVILSNDKISKDVLHIYKNRLQQYAQKRGLSLPVYTCEFEGPPHACRYKSSVTLDGKIYEAPACFPTIKDAEHAAAKVACEALSVVEIQEDKGLYKNLLQAMAQKRGLKYPIYETSPAGPPRKPVFVSVVEVGSDTFQGTKAKTKKQAEMNAAEVAYIALTKSYPEKGVLDVSSSMGSTAANDLKGNMQPTAGLKDENEGKIIAKRQKTSSENVNADMTGSSTHNSSLHGASSLSIPAEHSIAIESVKQSVEGKHRTNVVYPRSTNRAIPDGATVMSYSDDQWVAYKFG